MGTTLPTPTAAERVGATVRAELARRGIPARALGEHLGIGVASMSYRINGKTPFDVDELDKVAKFLDLDLATLVS